MKKSGFLILFVTTHFFLWSGSSFAQKKNNYYVPKAESAPVIDGIGNEKSWENAEWAYINQPYDGTNLPDSTDFYGRYKVLWTDSRLYVLMEITDDKLVDNRANPTSNYWEDDCTEFFIDEDNIHEGHECGNSAYNAFAYHIAAVSRDSYDYENGSIVGFDAPEGINHVIDLGKDCNTNNAMNFDDHVKVKINKDGNKYTWELEFKIFDKSYNENSIDNIPVNLESNKVIGFAIAYCDDDSGNRDNMIGNIPEHNDYNGPYPFYRFTNEYGTLTLVDQTTSSKKIKQSGESKNLFCPNPVKNTLNFKMPINEGSKASVNVYSFSGQLLLHEDLSQKRQSVNIAQLPSGTYVVEMNYAGSSYNQVMIKN